MAFITKSNANRILRKIDLSNIGEVEGDVYKKPIYFLGKSEVKYLLLMQALLKDPEKFAIEVYKPVINVDTFRLVYESEQPPSYHENKSCERLASRFKNFEIPFEIKIRANEKGGEELEKTEVHKFRGWFKQNIELYKNEPANFLKKLDIDWGVQRNVSEIEKDNSGIKEIENYDLQELEKEIDKIISEAGRFFVTNPDKQSVIRRFQKLTFLAYSTKEIYSNDTGLSDPELKEFLLKYDQSFKKPLKRLLLEYYRVKYNPELSFQGKLLEQLNFRPCFSCSETDNGNNVINAINDSEILLDDLPY